MGLFDILLLPISVPLRMVESTFDAVTGAFLDESSSPQGASSSTIRAKVRAKVPSDIRDILDQVEAEGGDLSPMMVDMFLADDRTNGITRKDLPVLLKAGGWPKTAAKLRG